MLSSTLCCTVFLFNVFEGQEVVQWRVSGGAAVSRCSCPGWSAIYPHAGGGVARLVHPEPQRRVGGGWVGVVWLVPMTDLAGNLCGYPGVGGAWTAGEVAGWALLSVGGEVCSQRGRAAYCPGWQRPYKCSPHTDKVFTLRISLVNYPAFFSLCPANFLLSSTLIENMSVNIWTSEKNRLMSNCVLYRLCCSFRLYRVGCWF